MTTTKTFLKCVLLLTVVGLVLAGCGNGDTPDDAATSTTSTEDTVDNADTTTAAVPPETTVPAETDSTGDPSAPPAGETEPVDASGTRGYAFERLVVTAVAQDETHVFVPCMGNDGERLQAVTAPPYWTNPAFYGEWRVLEANTSQNIWWFLEEACPIQRNYGGGTYILPRGVLGLQLDYVGTI